MTEAISSQRNILMVPKGESNTLRKALCPLALRLLLPLGEPELIHCKSFVLSNLAHLLSTLRQLLQRIAGIRVLTWVRPYQDILRQN
jgi:hypothetical protein